LVARIQVVERPVASSHSNVAHRDVDKVVAHIDFLESRLAELISKQSPFVASYDVVCNDSVVVPAGHGLGEVLARVGEWPW